ncbi:MAG: hypothetical protein COB54_06420 [Alphaproteobacteria bacterium]|nr:MAG: hypothetical protein COB54_06420 [Alphaproteobacteria bacterium]
MQKLPDTSVLTQRAILTISGPGRKSFLQGLITNNVEKITDTSALYAALLTPQGKYLHDFFISEVDDTLYLDCERDRLADLYRRLMMYKLRAEVDITDCSGAYTVLATSDRIEDSLICYPDPRHAAMGFRAILAASPVENTHNSGTDYDSHRLALGLPDGSRDFDVDRTLILEGNMEQLNGVDFNKGCYVGQEVTARMKHRSNLKKRLLPVTVEGDLPERGTEITDDNGKKIGDIRSGRDGQAIGYFRLAHMEFDQTYVCGQASVTPWRPDWLTEQDT